MVRQVMARIALIVFGTALGALLFEAGARLALRPRGGGKEGGEGRSYTRYDPLLGWSKLPGARVTYRREEYTVELLINSQGLRDPERAYQAAPGTWRALALGDSFVEGYSVPLAETLTQVLERDLRREGHSAEIINAGTMAWSNDQEYLFFRSEGLRYHPQVVLLFLYYNDILYNDSAHYYGRPKPLLELDGAELRPRRHPRQGPPAEAAKGAPGPEAPPARELATLWGSAALAWAHERLADGAPALYDRLASGGLLSPRERRMPRPEMRVYAAKPAPGLDSAWRKTLAILAALKRETAASGAQFLVVYVPSRMEVQDDSWDLTLRTYRLRPGQWERDALVRRLERASRAGNYPVLDLTRALRAVDRGPWGRPYFAHDGHWTALGHRAVAQALRAELGRLGWLPPPGTSSAGGATSP